MEAEITSTLVPLRQRTLLVPGSAVAEIAVWRRLSSGSDQPDWLMGFAAWRERRLPVLDLEALMDPHGRATDRGRCLVVMNRSRGDDDLSFYGIAGGGLPRLVRIAREDLTDYRPEPSPWILGSASLGMESVDLPDLAAIEDQLRKLPQPA